MARQENADGAFGFALMPLLAKLAVSDLWLMSAQLLTLLSLLFYLKKQSNTVLVLFFVGILLGMAIHPLRMLLSLFVLLPGLFFTHSGASAMKRLVFFGPFLGVVAIGGLLNMGNWNPNLSFFLGGIDSTFGTYLMYLSLGILPWLGFLPTVLWDLAKKLRAKEELAIISFWWLLAGLLSQSLLPLWILALHIGKHLTAHLDRKYPYSRALLFFCFTNMLITFFAAFLMMMSGYLQFAAQGFRSAVAVGATYWMFMLFGTIGLLGRNKSLAIGGLCSSALLPFFLFWMNIAPIIEDSRGMVRNLCTKAASLNADASAEVLKAWSMLNLIPIAPSNHL